VPVQLYESSVHSSYGIAFALLLVWVGALAVRERRRGRLPAAALVALAAPLLFLAVFSLAIAYDPARMRFVAFPVALASSAIGIALRARPVAWAAVALTVPALAISVGYFAPRPAGFALLPGHGDPERSTRWFVQSESGNGDGVSFRFMEEQIPNDATVAVALRRDTYLYPVWDAGLRRTILFETPNGTIPSEATWLVVGRDHELDVRRLEREGWRLRLSSPKGWRIFSR
jgi:hypothetical protein